jgi:Protein of unknown function (DUF2961)
MRPAVCALALLMLTAPAVAQDLYDYQPVSPRWASPENPTGAPGQGGKENRGAKGHPFDTLRAGQSLTLADVQGSGVIRRIWVTIGDRSPQMLRALRLEMFWDGAAVPAVAVPLGDFFGPGLGQTASFENALFSSPEGRSFNAVVPMPFRTSARIVLTNDSKTDLTRVFYDVDYTLGASHGVDVLYFHALWRRERPTTLTRDFEILPRIEGRGRYLGASVGVITDPSYGETWWGEGEVKAYLDADTAGPTLVGTGTEDYIGTGWGQGIYTHRYQGAPVADKAKRLWAFYRFHVPDPIFFSRACRITLQQIGGASKAEVHKLMTSGVTLTPITLDAGDRDRFLHLMGRTPAQALDDPALADGWVNFYRRDDVSATAYFYLDRPAGAAMPLAPVAERTAGLPEAGSP